MVRRADFASATFVGVALVQLLAGGAVTVMHGRAEAQPQAVINQRQTDRLEVIYDRVDKVEKAIAQTPMLVERVDRAVKDIADMRAMHTAIFVGLALNLIATFIQIRSQQTRRTEQHGRHAA